ncbi:MULTISPECIES: hypothetical protein [unclassified Aureimonas]|uniref:hypothetical protein n=1 Tax=unclassified Aureimonas TaxID=2615206 RepID=UPI0006FB88FD|nr:MULTISPECIES: hypothetical protein [unclassified Aureimonas]KQT69678.1 hypothetical protein ASG62_00670 [Aureimonas sp. Leaf427]KQT76169.1 hypothetical protein ASG54_15550 [Aureimonas sp. Leaf460]
MFNIPKYISTIVVASMALSGCVSSTNYASLQEAMKGSPELVEKMTDDCAGSYHGSATEREYLAKLARVPNNDKLPKVICLRAYRGIATGRITYEDFMSMSSGQLRPVVIRVIQNR